MLQLGYCAKNMLSRCAFLVVSAGILALMSFGNTATAQYAYTDVESDDSFSNASFGVDMDHDGINEFNITHSDGAYVNLRIVAGNNPNDHLTGVWVHSAHGNYARVLLEGEMVDETSYIQPGSRWLIRDNEGLWMGVTGYIGLELVIDGYTHYGWLHLNVAKNGSRVRVNDYAYSTKKWGSIPAGAGDTLPVELTTFNALRDGDQVELKWGTLSETANAGFELQHKFDGTYSPVAFIPGNGTSSSSHSYTYRMSELQPGKHSFRLKQVDVGGNYSYGPEVEVAIDVPGDYILGNAYPNPFNPQASFTLAVQATQQVDVSVYNTLGQKVASLYAGTLEGGTTHNFTIDGSSLSSGLYIYRVQGENFSATKTVSLLK